MYRSLFALIALLSCIALPAITFATAKPPIRPALRVELQADSTAKQGQILYDGARVRTKSDGIVEYLVMPYKSTRIRQYACTDLQVERLLNLGNKIQAILAYKNILFCPYRAHISVNSTFKGKSTNTLITPNGGMLVATSGRIGISQLDTDTFAFGNARGENAYLSTISQPIKRMHIEPSKFRAFDGKTIGEQMPIEAPTASVESNNSLICSAFTNILISSVENKPSTLGNKACINAIIGDRVAVLTPSGESAYYNVLPKSAR